MNGNTAHDQLMKYARDLNHQVRRLKEKNTQLEKARDEQKERVKERTAELMAANRRLESQIRLRKIALKKNEALILNLQKALGDVRVLSGLIPICAHCKSIRDDEGFWRRIEEYIGSRTTVEFSHGICPDCLVQFYPEYHSGASLDS